MKCDLNSGYVGFSGEDKQTMMLLLIVIDVGFDIEDGNVNNDLAALLE